jgi:hypothetical protein
VEQRALGGADDVPLPQAVDKLLLALLVAEEETNLGGRALCKDFAELAKLEQRDSRIGREVLFSLRRERDEAWVMMCEVSEVG